ncbi:hypothetical protein PILCRDRAFT_10032 [Piloderma croceum F 1598]|uniref:Uncharacterized protein n=1 Tax=Piloderma croceum (strain F 1598) TaxID=765440 RepID=A0A0C3F583_PILCF|nr:hypothetical protein PILCRDRAFT_10032 [Piloderma croceum F 1598]
MLTHGQPAPSMSSNNDTANITQSSSCSITLPAASSHPVTPPDVNHLPITPPNANSCLATMAAVTSDSITTSAAIPLPSTPARSNSSLLSSPSSITPSPTPSESDPGTPPGHVSCSDSDSDSNQPSHTARTAHFLVNMSQNTRTTLLNMKTTTHFSIELGKPPIITSGKLTPELLADFENGCFAYFAWKDVAKDQQVMKIAWWLQDMRMQVWYRTNCDRINAASFPAFMALVRAQWLPAGWEHNVRCLILSSSQQNLPVVNWIRLLESTNAILVSTTSHLTSAHLHAHIETHLHADTQIAAHLAETHLVLEYAAYVHAIKLIDHNRIRQATLLQEVVSRMYVPANLSHCDRTPHVPTANAPATSTSSNTVADCLPALMTIECTLLQDNEGCFKCCVSFADHLSCNCLTRFPDKASYKLPMEADITIAKRHKANMKATKAAAVLPVDEPTIPAAVVMPSSVLYNGLDSECVDTPFSSPHFFVDVIIGGFSSLSQCPVHALIDHGCDSVLINPKLMDHLRLTCRKLPKLKSVVMAVEGDKRKEIVFREFMHMSVIFSDQSWSSHLCRAIIAPNLCAPLILGNVFMAYNHFVINHKLCTCIDKVTGYDRLNPPKITCTVIKPKPRFRPDLKKKQKAIILDIKSLFPQTLSSLNESAQDHVPCPITAIRSHVEA